MDCLIRFHCLAELCEAANGAKVRFHYRILAHGAANPSEMLLCFPSLFAEPLPIPVMSPHILLSEAGGDCIVTPAECLQSMYTEEAKHRNPAAPTGQSSLLFAGNCYLFMRFTFKIHL